MPLTSLLDSHLKSSQVIDVKALAKILTQAFPNKDLAVFAGAGISHNSGLPLAIPLSKKILEAIGLSQEQLNAVMASDLPFESLVEAVCESGGIEEILEVFSGGRPCPAHRFISEMIKRGFLDLACTTNFDCLIEESLDDLSLRKNRDYVVRWREDQFTDIIDPHQLPQVIKVHGSAHDPTSVAVTLQSVSSERLSGARSAAIEKLFTGSHEGILFLGYSCSDIFDIVPKLEEHSRTDKLLLFVQHTPGGPGQISHGARFEPIQEARTKNPFREYRKGWRIFTDTDELILALEKESGADFSFGVATEKPDWNAAVERWASYLISEVSRCSLSLAAGTVLFRISNLTGAKEKYLDTARMAKADGDAHAAAVAASNLSSVSRQMGDSKNAIVLGDEAIRVFREIGNSHQLAKQLSLRGIERISTRHYAEAISSLDEALLLARQNEDDWLESNILCHLGVANYHLDHLSTSMSLLKSGLAMALDAGNPLAESVALVSLANLKRKQAQTQEAEALYQEGREAAGRIGDRRLEMTCLGNLGSLALARSDWGVAEEYLQMALHLARLIGLDKEERQFLLYLAASKAQAGRADEASPLFQSAYEISTDHSDFSDWIYFELKSAITGGVDQEELISFCEERLDAAREKEEPGKCLRYLHLAGLLQEKDRRFEEARARYYMALGIAKSIGNQKARVVFMRNVANCDGNLGRHDMAEILHRRAFGVAVQIGFEREIALCGYNVGVALMMKGQFSSALPQFEAAQHAAHSTGDARLEAKVAGNMGACHLNLDSYAEAATLSKKAISLLESSSADGAEDDRRIYRENFQIATRLLEESGRSASLE